MSAESRLGREQIETAYALKQITDAGVRVFFYLEDRERTLDSAMDKVMLSLTNFAAEMEREKGRQRTHDAMRRKAEAGHVAGGRVFGYVNREVLAPLPGPDGRPRRAHAERDIHPEQVDVVRRIFAWCAAGQGLRRIAKALNAAGVPGPRPGGHGWAPSAVREILKRELYRGHAVWNRTKWVDRAGTKRKVDRPKSEWLVRDAPDLRIVSEAEWTAAHARITRTTRAYLRGPGGHLGGRPEAGLESRVLLTGFSVCRACGGAFLLRHDGQRHDYYACAYHRLRGSRICPNGLTVPMPAANRAVLDALRRDVLAPEVVERALVKTLRLATAAPETSRADREALERELRPLEAELGRLAELVARGEPFPSIQAALQTRERRRAALRARLAHLDGLAAVAERLDPEALLADLRDRLADWQGLLDQEPVIARQILRKLLTGRIVFTPRPEAPTPYYEFTGQVAYGRLLAGVVRAKSVVPPG